MVNFAGETKMVAFPKSCALLILTFGLGEAVLAQEILIDAACENATVNGVPGYIDFSDDGALGIWSNESDDFLALVDPARHPPCQQVAGEQVQPTPQPITTQPTQPTATQPATQQPGNLANEFLAAHNKHRKKKNLTAVQWSDELAKIADEWAKKLATEQCGTLTHRPKSFTKPRNLGENLATASASPNPPTGGPASAVDDWASEEQFYSYATNTCADGKDCGHYTQIVWASTTEVGCSEASCDAGGWKTKMWVCNYRPAGNMQGQRPY